MGRFSSPIALCVTLLFGIVVGSSLDTLRWAAPVQANALNFAAIDDEYHELGSNDSVLGHGGSLLGKIAALTTPSVVHIQSERRADVRGVIEETGSGVVIQSHGRVPGDYVVTNRHVVNGAALEDISIHLHDGRVIHPAHIWQDAATDVAVLKVDVEGLRAARWGDSDSIGIGHMVLAMGSPFGLSQSVTFGIISAKGRRSLKLGASSEVINQDFLQTDAAINPGNSGGPLIDMQGRVIGINTAIASNSGGNEGIGFSIPSNLVKRVFEQLLEHGKVQRAYLGVKLDPNFNPETARRLGLTRARGARVVEVYPNTPASTANLKFDDVILSFDGIDVLDENHLINLVSLTPVEKRIRMVVMRQNQKLTIQVVLGDRQTLDARSEIPPQPELELGNPIIPN